MLTSLVGVTNETCGFSVVNVTQRGESQQDDDEDIEVWGIKFIKKKSPNQRVAMMMRILGREGIRGCGQVKLMKVSLLNIIVTTQMMTIQMTKLKETLESEWDFSRMHVFLGD